MRLKKKHTQWFLHGSCKECLVRKIVFFHVFPWFQTCYPPKANINLPRPQLPTSPNSGPTLEHGHQSRAGEILCTPCASKSLVVAARTCGIWNYWKGKMLGGLNHATRHVILKTTGLGDWTMGILSKISGNVCQSLCTSSSHFKG